MVSMAIPSQVCSHVCTRGSIERKPWNSEARNDVLGFLAQSVGLVCAAIFLYSLGPALGMTLIVVSLVVWSLLRSQIAFEEDEDRSGEDGGYAASLNSSHCANPVWIRSDRFGTSPAAATRSVQRQGV
jgi:hypothetical protein